MGSKRVRHDWVTSTFTEVYEVTLDFLISLSPYFLIMLKEMLNGLDFQSIFIPTINFLTKNMYEAWGSCLLSVHLYAVSYLILNKQYQGNYQSKYQASILSGYSISTPQYPSGTYGEGSGNPLQYSCLEFHGQKSLMGYSPCGRKESDMTEWLVLSEKFMKWHLIFPYLYHPIFLLCWNKYWMA